MWIKYGERWPEYSRRLSKEILGITKRGSVRMKELGSQMKR